MPACLKLAESNSASPIKVYVPTTYRNIFGLGRDPEEEKEESAPTTPRTTTAANVITTQSRDSSAGRATPPRPPPILTSASALVSADTPTMRINTAMLPPEDRELKRDVVQILKWKAVDYDTPAGRRDIKAHYDNV
jgi:hypothetical protein